MVNEWTHIVFVCDETKESHKLYVNGVSVTDITLGGVISNLGDISTSTMGINNAGTTVDIDIDFSDVWHSNTKLNTEQVNTLYNNGVDYLIDTGVPAYAYYKFEDNTNDETGVYDLGISGTVSYGIRGDVITSVPNPNPYVQVTSVSAVTGGSLTVSGTVFSSVANVSSMLGNVYTELRPEQRGSSSIDHFREHQRHGLGVDNKYLRGGCVHNFSEHRVFL